LDGGNSKGPFENMGAPGKLKIKSPNDQIHPLQIMRLNFHPLPRRTLQTLLFPIEHIPRVINKS
jgi:hypothetical protein